MSQDNKTAAPEAKASGRLMGRIFGHGEHQASGPKPTLDLGDIQGFILRGYRMPIVRHFLLSIGVPVEARKLLGRLVSGDESDAPQITTAEYWHVGFAPGPGDNPNEAPRRKPDYCLNVGITWPGIIALEIKDRVPTLGFKSFGAFTAGAAERAKLVGETGPSAPEKWIGGFGKGRDHVLVTVHALSPDALNDYSNRLAALFSKRNAFREIWRTDGMAWIEMKDGKPEFTSKVPFGYTDGISMTTIRGGPEHYPPDHQQPCEPWLFVLRDEAENYFVPEPKELGLNGSFAVFKMIMTDVVGFENFLQSSKDKIEDNPARPLKKDNPNGLQDELIRHLKEDNKMSRFDFGVQFLDTAKVTYWGERRDANFWIENASVEWNEAEAPFHTVARLTLLPKSQLEPAAGEAEYFDVTGNSTPDSTPVGSINRARCPAEVASRKARMRGETGCEHSRAAQQGKG